jgi:hypothetical protein
MSQLQPWLEYEKAVFNLTTIRVEEMLKESDIAIRMNRVHVTQLMNERLRGLVIQLNYHLAAGDRQVVETKTQALHADWKQMFKAKYFHRSRLGRWLLKKYPIRMTHLKHETLVITRMCPHVNLPPNNNRHVEFMVLKDNAR